MRGPASLTILFWSTILVGCGGQPAVERVPYRVILEGADTPRSVASVQSGDWFGGAPANTRVLVGADGETYVGVWIDAPSHPGAIAVQVPIALSLVIDTSGSMEGEKIANARMAAASMLETLSDGDVVSVYAFSNGATEIAPPTVVDPTSRAALMARVQGLVATGGTNMWDGLRAAQAVLAQTPATHSVRRLVLISDGHANIGPSDTASMQNLAANGTEWGIQVSAIGVGLDYDERLLAVLAVQSSGRVYHLQHPAQMAEILREELQLLAQTIGTDAVVEIAPASGVEFLGVESLGATLEEGRVRVPIGALHAGQRREILVRARIDTSAVGARELGQARLQYRDATEGRAVQDRTVALAYEVTDDRSAVEASAAPRVTAMVAARRATEAQLQAAAALERGDVDVAAMQFQFAADRYAEGEQAAPPAQQQMYREQANRARESVDRARRARTVEERRSVALPAADAAMEMSGY
jgi:Ca-activated chloride channel family protein